MFKRISTIGIALVACVALLSAASPAQASGGGTYGCPYPLTYTTVLDNLGNPVVLGWCVFPSGRRYLVTVDGEPIQ